MAKEKAYKVNVTGMTKDQFDWVNKKAIKAGTNRAAVIKGEITSAMEKEEDK